MLRRRATKRTKTRTSVEHLTYFWNLLSLYSAQRRIGGDSASPGGRRHIRGIPHPPPAAPAAGGWGIPGSAFRRVDRGLQGGVAAEGWSASSFWCSAASPPRRRLRRCCLAAGTSLLCRCFLRCRRWRTGDGCTEDRWRRCRAAAVGVRGLQVEDLAVSGEMVWRWPQIWCGWCLGQVPGRRSFIVLRTSSAELVDTAAQQRLRARSASAPRVTCSGDCVLRRLRRWGSSSSGVWRSKMVTHSGGVLCIFFVVFFACISSCTVCYV